MRLKFIIPALFIFVLKICGQTTGYAGTAFIQDMLPVPQQIKTGNDIFEWNDELIITHSPGVSVYVENFRYLSGLSFKKDVEKKSDVFFIIISNKAKVRIPGRDKKILNKGDEAYSLSADKNSIKITANSGKGLLWGLMTLAQLIEHDNKNTVIVRDVEIADWPRYSWRGYMLDTGRAPYSPEQIKRIIRICSAFKLNFLIIREGDDELNAFRFNDLPLGSDNPYALTMNDISDLIAYGKKYGLTVFPEIESLGHIESKRKFYPELVQGGIRQDYWPGFYHIRKANLDINNPGTYKLLYAMYDEIFPLLSVPMIHLGLDEVRLTEEEQAEHFSRLIPLTLEVGKKYNKDLDILVWSDAPPTPAEYQDKVIRCLWRYGNKITKDTKKLDHQGMNDLLKPGCRERVFMAGGSGTHHEPYSKDSYSGALINLYSWAKTGENHPNFTGIYAVQWASNTIDEWIPDFLMAADFGWHVPAEEPEYTIYMQKLSTRLKALKDYITPSEKEVPRPAWDGIWLNGDQWGEDIMTGEKAAPVVSIEPDGGYFSGKLRDVKISSTLPQAKIFYTIDGTIPDRSSTLYFEPVTIDSTLGIKAVAYLPGRAHSKIKEALFIDSSFQSPPAINARLKKGLTYSYFEAAVVKASELKNLNPAKTGIAQSVMIPAIASGKEKFGFIFDGYLSVPADGRYTFSLLSNDGSRLFINGKEVINNDGRHGVKEKQVKLALKKGIYPLTVKYFQYGGGKELKLFWEGPRLKKQEISEEYYFHK